MSATAGELAERAASLAIPDAAWSRRIGEPLEAVGRPLDRPYEMIDDGPWGGVPLGGIGSGSIGRTPRGDFARWHLEIGRHRFEPAPGCQFAVFVGPAHGDRRDGDGPDGDGASPTPDRQAHVLSTIRPDGAPSAWAFDLPVGAGTYHALFPRAWCVYDWEYLPVRITAEQLSPVLPGNECESSYPVGLFEYRITNPTPHRLRVGILFGWQDVGEAGPNAPSPRGAWNEGVREPDRAGVVLHVIEPGSSERPVAFAIAAAEEDGVRATYRSRFTIDDGSDVWADFGADGALDDVDDRLPAGEGEAIGGAVAATVELSPGETRSLRFSLAWDIPVMGFGSGTRWYRRYTRFFGRRGDAAWRIAGEGLARQREWREAIEAWQRPYLDDPSRPAWYTMALLNELYILIDGGSAWEDGRVGGPQPPDGEGRFSFLECYDYPFYDTHDVLFYASFALAMLWPGLERRTMRSLIESLPLHDAEMVTVETTGERVERKTAGAVPHDLGAPNEDPWLRLNAYAFQDSGRWKDLNSKFVLQLWRDRVMLDDPALVREGWPAVLMALERLAAFDRDGDGLPDHDGFPDQTFDTWTMEGASAYGGGLWLAATAAAVEMAREVGDSSAEARLRAVLARGGTAFERLWTGSYYRFDASSSGHADSVMADQLCGQWYADACGLPAFVPPERVETALRTVVERNVRGFADGRMGAVNGTRPDGSVDESSQHSREVWPGVSYALAAFLFHRGMDEEAWETARGAVRVTYERGFWFRTPEAWDAEGDFRASLYMRPLSIWAIEHALRGRAASGQPSR